jgi:hypothetical protein|tara:strand:- start:847 stop:1431 length:585 start_codon:yes stop_codon:yes gene_type:complete
MGTIKTTNIQSISGSGTVTLGTSGETFALGSNVSVTGNGLVGITVADNWRLNVDDAVDGTGTDLDTGWERVDTAGQGTIGSAMTESSGVFTFPSTGIYFVQLQLYYVNGTGASYTRSIIKHDNGSGSQTSLADVRGYAGSSEQDVVTSSTLFDCQNTSTDKVVFYGGGTVNGNVIAGSTTDNRSAATFIRLGDT